MNYFILIVFVIFSFFQTGGDENTQDYPFKSGMIKYKFDGRASGTETIYFDDYGKLCSRLKITSTGSNLINKHDSVLTILRHDTIFEIDVNRHTLIINTTANSLYKSKQNIISSETIETLGFSKTGSNNIAGKQCIKFTGENGNLWTWKNIVMKTEMNIMNIHITKEVTEIIMGISIPKSKFEIPKI